MPPTLSVYFIKLPNFSQNESSTFNQPADNLARVLRDAKKLQSFLNDTFQLLMSSISVRDSKLSIIQAELSNQQAALSAAEARRSAWLTQLASIYLPLSIVTGIFGMNIKEINGSPVKFWWCIVILVILIAFTVAIYFVLRALADREQKRAEQEKLKKV